VSAEREQVEAVWLYCPECGSKESESIYGKDSQSCDNCGQEWFPSIDYSEVVRKNLIEARAERDAARRTSQYWKDEKLASEREIDTLRTQLAAARVVTDAMVERFMDAYEIAYRDGNTHRFSIRAALTAALSEAP
jgi:uncharacterized Zn finger protein